MARATFIFGNGLGRALDNDYFDLTAGLREVWTNNDQFTNAQRDLVISSLNNLSEERFPEKEEQLDKLQVALLSASILKNFETDNVKWLRDESRELPDAFRRFIHEVAAYFHNSGQGLPVDFVQSLTDEIRRTASHVATLNYDNLLYDALKDQGVLRGYYDTLIDGFRRNGGFNPTHLDRNRPDEKAWYLHLHGSPLYIGNQKLMGVQRDRLIPSETSHIVLTHVKHKPLLISNSTILEEYWERLATALRESERVILVGYSGQDPHLNKVINDQFLGKNIRVVERKTPETQDSVERFWKARFPKFQTLVHRPISVLDVTEWADM